MKKVQSNKDKAKSPSTQQLAVADLDQSSDSNEDSNESAEYNEANMIDTEDAPSHYNNSLEDDDDNVNNNEVTLTESASIPELVASPSKGGFKQKIQSLGKMNSLRKVISFYDIEANFHGDKNMHYDPNVKFSKLGEAFWRLDFKPSSLKRWPVYRDNIKFLFGLGWEVIAVGGAGALYIWGLSSIPYTRPESHYYDPWMIALYYFLTLFTLFLVIGYGFFVMVYGLKNSMMLLLSTVLPGCIIAVLPFIFLAAGVEPWFYFLDLLFYLFVGILFGVSAMTVAKKVVPKDDKQQAKDLFLAYTTPLGLHAAVIGLYAFVIIPYYRALTNDVVRAIFRLIIHPVVCQINMAVAAFFCKKYPRVEHQHLTTGVVFGIYVESAMFGRFLIATVGSLSSQLATSAAVGLLDIAIRAFVLKREHLTNFIMKRVIGMKDLNFNEAKERAYQAQFNNISMIVEHVSILVVPFLLHAFYKHRFAFNFSYGESPPDISELYRSAGVQFGIQIVVHFVCCVLEYLMKIPNILVWKQERRVYVLWEIANYIQILTLIVYVFKTLPAVFFCSDMNDPCSCNNSSYFDLSLFFKEGFCSNHTL